MRAALVAVFGLLAAVHADVYMHNPRGSNDRNCERNVNRDNGNRLFNSQNNAKGGYACPRAVGGPEVQRLVPAADNVFGPAPAGLQYYEKMYYYPGSKLPIEWTAQHGCGGNAKTNCQIVLQYACEDTLDPFLQYRAPLGSNDHWIGAPRDGLPTDSNDAATDTITDPRNTNAGVANTEANRRFGMHENPEYYLNCTYRSRNRGLFTADQQINRNDARGTRQNPNGDRHGLECPEERDYYPYWHPTPWIDIAILHDFSASAAVTAAWCNFYKTNSQNSATSKAGECVPNYNSPTETPAQVTARMNNGQWWNNRYDCEARNHTFVLRRLGLPAGSPLLTQLSPPDCQVGQYSRINQLGNADAPTYQDPTDQTAIPKDLNAARYVWNIPSHVNENCALRIRYNISTSDYQPWRFDAANPTGTTQFPAGTPGVNASLNGRTNSPVTQNPYVYLSQDDTQFVALKVNTNQYGRTFQDRSYVFAIRQPTGTLASDLANGAKIYNLNVRGKRGNIVQTYPAVEYDFVPDDLNVQQGHYIHFQWTGSDYNPRRGCNDATGGPPDPNTATAANDNSRADRSNIVPIDVFADNYPSDVLFPQNRNTVAADPTTRPVLSAATIAGRTMFDTTDQLLKFAFIKQNTFLSPAAPCLTQTELNALANDQVRDNHPRNCAKLNAAFYPYFDGGAMKMNQQGSFAYFCSRNNNFSNRDQTGRICIYTAGAAATCTGAAAIASGGKIATAFVPPEVIASNLITQETFAFNAAENDATGDGQKKGCSGLDYSLTSMDQGQVVGLAFGMIILGSGLVLIAQFGVRYYLDKPKGLSDICFGGDGKAAAKGVKASVYTKKAPPPPPKSSPVQAGSSKGAPPPPPRSFASQQSEADNVPLFTASPLNAPPPPPAVKPASSLSPQDNRGGAPRRMLPPPPPGSR